MQHTSFYLLQKISSVIFKSAVMQLCESRKPDYVKATCRILAHASVLVILIYLLSYITTPFLNFGNVVVFKLKLYNIIRGQQNYQLNNETFTPYCMRFNISE